MRGLPEKRFGIPHTEMRCEKISSGPHDIRIAVVIQLPEAGLVGLLWLPDE